MVRKILLWPDPTLKLVSRLVVGADAEQVQQLVQDLKDTLAEVSGVGLSAIQVGVPLRVFVLRLPGSGYEVYVNPTVTTNGSLVTTREGCLSFPGVFEKVKRWSGVRVTHDTLELGGTIAGSVVTEAVSTEPHGLLRCQALQHEAEHLDGVTLHDKVSFAGRERIKGAARRWRK